MATQEISKTEARNLNVDLSTLAEANEALADGIGIVKDRTAQSTRAMFLIGAAADRVLSASTDNSAKNLAESFGVVPSTISYGRRLAFLARLDAGRVEADEVGDKDHAALKDLETFYNYANPVGTEHFGSFHTFCDWLTNDDGSHRAQAIRMGAETFGSTNGAYMVLTAGKNQRFHEDDPRSVKDDGDQGGDDEQGENDDAPKVSGEELLTRGVRKCREQGMADTDIAAFVMGLLSNK